MPPLNALASVLLSYNFSKCALEAILPWAWLYMLAFLAL